MLGTHLTSAWQRYCNALRNRPYTTQSITSAILWYVGAEPCGQRCTSTLAGALLTPCWAPQLAPQLAPHARRGTGDVIAQRLEATPATERSTEQREPTAASPGYTVEGQTDLRRVSLVTAYGFAVVGPLGHWWYEKLDTMCTRRWAQGTARLIGAKIVLDTVVFNPVHVSSWFGLMGLLSGDSMRTIADQFRDKFWPTLVAESVVWPAVQWINFWRVPVKHQLLVVNIVSLADCTALSWVKHADGLGDLGRLQWMRDARSGFPFGP